MSGREAGTTAPRAIVWFWVPGEPVSGGHIALALGNLYLSRGPLLASHSLARPIYEGRFVGRSLFEEQERYGPAERIVIPRDQISIEPMLAFAREALRSAPWSLPVLAHNGRPYVRSHFHDFVTRRDQPVNCVTTTAACIAAGLELRSPEKSRRICAEVTPLGLAKAIEEVFGVRANHAYV